MEQSKQLVPVPDSKVVVGKLLPDTEIQEVYLLATMSRNIILAQCQYFLDLYIKFCSFFPAADIKEEQKEESTGEILFVENAVSVPHECRVGFIGCGRVGRALLTSIARSGNTITKIRLNNRKNQSGKSVNIDQTTDLVKRY